MWVGIDRVWSSKECVCCACDPSVHLDVTSIFFMCVYVISSFRSLKAGSQLFTLLVLFLCVIFHTKSLQFLCILPFGILCLFAIRVMFVKILLAVCMLVGIVV